MFESKISFKTNILEQSIEIKKKMVPDKLLTLVLLNKLRCHTHFWCSAFRLLDLDCLYKFSYWMANSADPDQLASSEANWSGSTLFANAGYIQAQQD